MWISCRIRSDSHTLSEAAFQLFLSSDTNIRIHKICERDFVISVQTLNDTDSEDKQLHHAHQVITAMLIAFNVAALGTFFWYDDPWVHPILHISEDFEGKILHGNALVVTSDTTYKTLTEIQEFDIENTALIFGIIARESSNVLTGEYCRGLLLLRMNFYDLNFRREAFLCFYRAFEHFVATRLLCVKKLKNELRDLERGLSILTDAKDLISELKELYSIRSSQVAHSQIEQREITFEEVMKIKIFLDFVIHKTFKDHANRLMQDRRDFESSKGTID